MKVTALGTVDFEQDGRPRSIAPGDSLAGVPAPVAAAATALWTTEVVASFAAHMAVVDPAPVVDITALARTECRRRIFATVPLEANLHLAHRRHTLTGADLTTYEAGMAWVDAMRAAWPTMEDDELDPYADASWPAVPAGLAELVGRF